MATITLYSGKINQMSSLINKAKTSVKSYKSDLKSLKSKVLSIDESICDVDDVISSIKSSTKTQEDKIETLENLKQDINDFISDVVRIDGDAADAINKSKDDFYDKYEYLKPECEKSGWEKFKDGCKKVGEWCKEHWKEILAIAVVITGVVLCFVPGLNWLGSGILIGSLKGALSGGLIGGLSSWASGGSFWEGFKDGVVTGAIFGGVFGGLGAAGEFLGNAKAVSLLANGKWLGKSCSFAKTVGTVAKASGAITFVMGGFDTLALGSKILFGDNWFSDFNAALHESSIYNVAQTTIASVAVFTGGMNSGFNKAANSAGVKPSCFVAGTLVMAVAGMVAIETIKSGDKVISTDPETMETSPKTVLETYIREVTTLVHLTVNGEEIVTTVNHPFYVQSRGFVEAGKLLVGDKLLDVNGNILLVENIDVELTDKPVKVYNFQVEDFHTYHVGENGVWVHNECKIKFSNKSDLDESEFRKQLKDQQDGLGELTIDEYKSNRQAYNDRKANTGSGRDPDSAKYQAKARRTAISQKAKEYKQQGYSNKESRAMAKAWAKGKAALHGPDQVAGGSAKNVSGLGDSKINSSIGSQWKSGVDTLDTYVNEQAEIFPGSTKLKDLDIQLVL